MKNTCATFKILLNWLALSTVLFVFPASAAIVISDKFNDESHAIPPSGWTDASTIDCPYCGGVAEEDAGFLTMSYSGGTQKATFLFNDTTLNVQTGYPISATATISSISPGLGGGADFLLIGFSDTNIWGPSPTSSLINAFGTFLWYDGSSAGVWAVAKVSSIFPVQVPLGNIIGYDGGSAILSVSFDETGFRATTDIGEFDSGKVSWDVFGLGFEPGLLGTETFAVLNGGDNLDSRNPYKVVVDSFSVSTVSTVDSVSVPIPILFSFLLAIILFGLAALKPRID